MNAEFLVEITHLPSKELSASTVSTPPHESRATQKKHEGSEVDRVVIPVQTNIMDKLAQRELTQQQMAQKQGTYTATPGRGCEIFTRLPSDSDKTGNIIFGKKCSSYFTILAHRREISNLFVYQLPTPLELER